MALTPGARLGVYDILTQIGAGGMGEVYRARDPKLDRDVAIKQIWAITPKGDRFLRIASDGFEGFTLMLGWPSRLEREGAEK